MSLRFPWLTTVLAVTIPLVAARAHAQESLPEASPAPAPAWGVPPAPPAPAPYMRPSPPVLDYEDGAPIPPGYHLVTKSQPEYTWGGLAFFGLTYGTAVYAASLISASNQSCYNCSADHSADVLFIPVAGPFLGIKAFKASPVGTFWLSAWGLAQGGGLVAMIYGLTTPKRTLWRNDIPGKIDVAPLFAVDGAPRGLAVSAAF